MVYFRTDILAVHGIHINAKLHGKLISNFDSRPVKVSIAFSDSYYVDCQELSFMKDFLTKQLHLNESRLRTYSSVEEYHHAMSLGSRREGIDAIFDEIPYMKLLMNKYDSQYKMVGPTYRTGGFAFVCLATFLIMHELSSFYFFCSYEV